MKTLYLLGWLISAIFLMKNIKGEEYPAILIINFLMPFILLIIRLIILHITNDEENEIPF